MYAIEQYDITLQVLSYCFTKSNMAVPFYGYNLLYTTMHGFYLRQLAIEICRGMVVKVEVTTR